LEVSVRLSMSKNSRKIDCNRERQTDKLLVIT